MIYPTSWPVSVPPTPRLRVIVGTVFFLCAGTPPLAAQWRLESWFGTAYNAPTRVTFSQINQPEISAMAHWSTRPWQPTWYYSGRIAKWEGKSGWAFTYMHHKMYMENPPPGVGFFRITNGVNHVLAERLWRRQGWEYGIGAGPIYAVPVSSVRGVTYNNAHGIFHSKYELAGVAVGANLARRIRLLPFTYGSLSLRATAAYLHVHIANGHATTSDFALHLQYGLSLQSRKK